MYKSEDSYYEISNKEEISEVVIPSRFYIGIIISIVSLFGILTFLIKKE